MAQTRPIPPAGGAGQVAYLAERRRGDARLLAAPQAGGTLLLLQGRQLLWPCRQASLRSFWRKLHQHELLLEACLPRVLHAACSRQRHDKPGVSHRNAEPRFGASEQLTKVALPAAEPRRPCCCALCAAAGALCCGSWRRRCGQLPLPTAAPAAVAVESGMSRKSLHTKCATRQRRAMACDCTTTASKGGCRGVPALQRICSHGMARSMLGHTLHSRIAAHKQYIAPQR